MPPINKKLLHPRRMRRIPRSGFSWIDRRFVTQGFAAESPQTELLLYLFLCVVADQRGLSFYGDRRLCEILKISSSSLDCARRGLEKRDLVLYRYPLYQVLSLPDEPAGAPPDKPRSVTQPGPLPPSIRDIVKRLY